MRTFISKTSGATFFNGCSYTFNIRKDSVEYIFKLDSRGWYIILNLIRVSGGWAIAAHWGDFFHRVFNHKEPLKLMAMLKRPCPTLYQIFTDPTSKYKIGKSGTDTGTIVIHHLPKHLGNQAFHTLIGNEELLDAAEDMAEFTLGLFHEIRNNIPFPAWKEALNTL